MMTVTQVIVAGMAGLFGVLAGLLPGVLVSRRRRALALLVEETSLEAEVKDEVARGHVRRALRASANQYADLVEQTPRQKAAARIQRLNPLLAVVALIGIVLIFGAPQMVDDQGLLGAEAETTMWEVLGICLSLGALLAMGGLVIAYATRPKP